MYTYSGLREQYPLFIFEKFEISETPGDLEVRFFFEIPGLANFSPCWHFILPDGAALSAAFEREKLTQLIFNLGMTELISYWKTACPPRVEIRAGYLNEDQISFWKKQYFLGLGEFFYTNGISAKRDDFMQITAFGDRGDTGTVLWSRTNLLLLDAAEERAVPMSRPAPQSASCLIPIGGGKDSAVTLEIMKRSDSLCYGYAINPGAASAATYEVSGLPSERFLAARRTLDKSMLRLNSEGYLNGHTPFSAIVAFSSVLQAWLFGIDYVILSNEASANESTVLGTDVNHQYSKSFEFERDFIAYEAAHISSCVHYFSLLRPLSELQIAGLFSWYRQYHDIFRSCNAGSKEGVWCGVCAKCLFVYIILSPYLSPADLRRIFGGALAENPALISLLDKLTGMTDEKPFECVGNRNEVNIALCLAVSVFERERVTLPALLEYYIRTPLYAAYKDRIHEFDTYYNTENALPAQFDGLLRSVLKGDGTSAPTDNGTY